MVAQRFFGTETGALGDLPLKGEQLHRAAKFEGAQAVIGESDDKMFLHGAILPDIGLRATLRRIAWTR